MITKKDKQIVKEMIEKNYISKKGTKLFLYCLLLLKHGWKKHKQIKEALKLRKKPDKWFNNLKSSGYFAEDGKIMINLGKYADIEFALMMSVAEGYLKRKIN